MEDKPKYHQIGRKTTMNRPKHHQTSQKQRWTSRQWLELISKHQNRLETCWQTTHPAKARLKIPMSVESCIKIPTPVKNLSENTITSWKLIGKYQYQSKIARKHQLQLKTHQKTLTLVENSPENTNTGWDLAENTILVEICRKTQIPVEKSPKSRESVYHLLFHCEITTALWNTIFSSVDLAWVMPRRVVDLYAC